MNVDEVKAALGYYDGKKEVVINVNTPIVRVFAREDGKVAIEGEPEAEEEQ